MTTLQTRGAVPDLGVPHDLETLVTQTGLLPREACDRARLIAAETGERFASVVTRLGLVSEQALAAALASATGLAVASTDAYPPTPPEGAGRVSARFLRSVKAVPIRMDDHGADVAFADPLDGYASDALAMALGRPLRRLIGRPSDIEAAIERAFGPAAIGEAAAGGADASDLERLKDLASDAPAIRTVNRLIGEAVDNRASDIHLEPTETSLLVRLRVDGVLRELAPLPSSLRGPVISRIKVMAGLNIAEHRLPQDGRLRLSVRGHEIDLRVATSPTIHGEGVVLRLLDRSQVNLDFAALGFEPGLLAKLRTVLAHPHGIVLVTGPTGSGKTTTLYAALAELNSSDRKLLTIEDPIEYRLPGINQTQVAPAIGLTFAAALRSFLRQDPDIMMVGEIRDLETAQVAIQAALTGHLILSTLHTNSAAAALTRLLDMSVEPFLITSTLNAVLAQRLVRRLCPNCRTPETRARLDALQLGRLLPAAWRPHGCPDCGESGYRGRLALTELLVLDDEIAQRVLARTHAGEIEAAARAAGMETLVQDGAFKVAQGLTSLDEVLRVTREA